MNKRHRGPKRKGDLLGEGEHGAGGEHDALLEITRMLLPDLIASELQSREPLREWIASRARIDGWARQIEHAIGEGRIPHEVQQMLWRQTTTSIPDDLLDIEPCNVTFGHSFYRYIDGRSNAKPIPELLTSVDMCYEFGAAVIPGIAQLNLPAVGDVPILSHPSEGYSLYGDATRYPVTLYAEVFPSSCHVRDVMTRMAQLEEAAMIDSVRRTHQMAKQHAFLIVTVSDLVFAAAVDSRFSVLQITAEESLHRFEPAQVFFQTDPDNHFLTR